MTAAGNYLQCNIQADLLNLKLWDSPARKLLKESLILAIDLIMRKEIGPKINIGGG
jgi:hypothetical protein